MELNIVDFNVFCYGRKDLIDHKYFESNWSDVGLHNTQLINKEYAKFKFLLLNFIRFFD